MGKHREPPPRIEFEERRISFAPLAQSVTIVVLAVLLGLSYFNSRSTRENANNLASRLDQIDSRLAKLSANVAQVASRSAAAPTQGGPDPNRVYPVKIDGAPMEGPITAAVTIAEFSDFQ
jgi:hypothetical protein